MKLYDFEKRILWQALYRIYFFFDSVWKNRIGKVFLTLLLYFFALVIVCIAFAAIIYFLIGVNEVLGIFHLGNYRIEKFYFGNSSLDLRPYFNK